MKVYFNGLGVVTAVDTAGDSLRQGSVNVSLEAIFDGIDNSYYSAKFDFTRNDGSRISGVVMRWDSENGEAFRYSFGDAWFFAKSGQTSLTIYLYDSEGTVNAQGQVQFNIEETDYGDEPTITINQFNSLMTALASKIGMPSSSLRVDELPETGDVGVFYVVHDDDNDPTRANIYVWNRDTEAYLWVGSNELDLNKYYTREEGGAFEATINQRVTSVENELESVASGSPKGVFGTLADLRNAYPSGDSNIYVVLEDGKWYYWNGTQWTAGGKYLESGIGDDVELLKRINLVDLLSQGKYDSLIQGSYVNVNGIEMAKAHYQEYVYNSPRFRYIKIGGYGASTVSAIAFYSSEQRNAITLISVVPYPIRDGDSIYEKYAEVPSACKCVVFSTRNDKDGVYAYGPAYDYLHETFISKRDGGELEEGIITSENDELQQKVYFGNGRIGAQNTDDGAYTYFDCGSITVGGVKYYYPAIAEDGGHLITDKWTGFSDYLPLSGGTMAGGIVSEGTGRKATFGDGILTLEDTVYGRKTEIGKYAITADGGNFYYPPAAEAGGNLITNKWSGFSDYLTKADAESEYAKKTDLNVYATKKDFDDLKSIVYGIHSLTYNSYEFSYLTSSIIPDEVDGRKVVGGSYAIADWVGGNSVAFNQLLNRNITSVQSINGLTATPDDNGFLTISGTATANTSLPLFISSTSPLTITKDHKYLLMVNIVGSAETYIRYNANGFQTRESVILTGVSGNGTSKEISVDRTNYPLVYVPNETTLDNAKVYVHLFDLTLMGLDNITTVDEFKALFPDDYYPYNSGEIKSTIVSKIESWGYNLFDGEWTGTSSKTSANFIKVVPGQTYTLEVLNLTTQFKILQQYNANKERIKTSYLINSNEVNSIALESDTNYVKLELRFASATDIPLDAVCFHRTGSRTGYAPYVGKLGEINIPNAPLTLNGVNDIHDLLTFEEQEDGTYNAILTRNIGIVDLGTLNWTLIGTSKFQIQLGSEVKGASSNSEKANILCERYQIGSWSQVYANENKVLGMNTSRYLAVTDTDYTDVASFKSAMSGVKLYCERTTPTSEVIATGLTFDQASFPIERGGSIVAVYEEVPPTASIDFMTKGE